MGAQKTRMQNKARTNNFTQIVFLRKKPTKQFYQNYVKLFFKQFYKQFKKTIAENSPFPAHFGSELSTGLKSGQFY